MTDIQTQLIFFAEQQKAGTLAPCWLLVGDRLLPKKEFAMSLAKQTLYSSQQQPHGMPDAFVAQHMDMNCYPNFLYVDRPILDDGTQAADINIETTKRIAAFVEKKPAVLGWRVVVIDAIDDMNRFGANSLLKTLEEPPHQTLFLIICHQQWHILPTIRSRCHVLNLNFLQEEQQQDPLQDQLSGMIGQVLKGQTNNIESFAQQVIDTDKTLQTFFTRVLMLIHQWCVNKQKPVHASVMPKEYWMNAYRAVNAFAIACKDTHLNHKHVILATFLLIQNPDTGDFSQLM
ncbi:MAG: hypothetical protein Q8K36_01885 [Alphaproteobacteria bacterium]|nr:hypothetical protein [Alphaproteobacteria bacterium]